MACHSQFLVRFFLLTLFCRAHGLQISMERTSENNLCGRLHCWQKVDMYGNIQAIIGMTVFEASKVHTESKLASIHLGVDNIILNQIKAEAMNGTGSISRFQADLTLDFYNETDCENETFLCELYFMNRNGQIEVIHQTVEPGNLNSKCDCAMTEIGPWQDSSAESFQSRSEIKNQLTGLKEEQIRIKEELTVQMREEQTKLKEELTVQMREEQAKMKVELNDQVKEEHTKMKEELTVQMREEHTKMKEELTVQMREEQAKIKAELNEQVKEEQTKMKEELTVQMREEQAKLKEELTVQIREEQIKMKEELTVQMREEQAKMKVELNEQVKEEQTKMKEELSVYLNEEYTNMKEELTRRLEEEQNKTNEELTGKLNKDHVGLREELNVLNDKLQELNKERGELKDELIELAEELSGLKEKLKELKKETLTEKNTTVREEMENLLYQVADIQSFLNSSQDSKGKNEKPVKNNCTRGMSMTCPRTRFMLWGYSLALCDTETDGGGWIIIQRRTKGDVDFFRNWTDYKNGFGTPDTDFWIGNDIIHNLTSQGYNELRIDMELEGRKYFAHYSHFSVGDEVSKYKLSVSGYSGTAGDSLTYHDGMKFSTFDQDNDLESGHCANHWKSAWWYNACHYSNLNGVWGKNAAGGVTWWGVNNEKSLSFTEIKIRHV